MGPGARGFSAQGFKSKASNREVREGRAKVAKKREVKIMAACLWISLRE
jgi:hypothetical protein